MTLSRSLLALVAPALLACLPATARAAESYDSCAGYIDSLPATITTQGTWCLRQDLATAMSLGAAVTVATNNVTIDCNHHKIGGLAAGTGSETRGVASNGRENITVRHCSLRGFYIGVQLEGGGGHVVEGNRIDNSLMAGIHLAGDSGLVRGNHIVATGGTPIRDWTVGIDAAADIIDNVVDGVFGGGTHTYPTGIYITLDGAEVRGNRVRGLLPAGEGYVTAIRSDNIGVIYGGNRIAASVATPGYGLIGGPSSLCTRNTVSRIENPLVACQDAGGNATNGAAPP